MKTEIFEELEALFLKQPKFEITPRDERNKEDKKKAKIMTELMNHMFEENIGGFQEKYYSYMKRMSELWVKEQLYGIKTGWDQIEKIITHPPQKKGELLNI